MITFLLISAINGKRNCVINHIIIILKLSIEQTYCL